MKRNLVLVALALIFGFAVSAVPAMATQFAVAGGNQIVRGEGHTETLNSVTVQNNGALAITVLAGTTINFDYSVTVTNAPDHPLFPPSNLGCTYGGVVFATGTCTMSVDESVSGKRITLTFTANTTFAPGDNVVLGQVRGDVAGLGAGVTAVNATLSSTPPSAGITYNPTSVPVAVVVYPSIKLKYTATTMGVLTCNAPDAAADPDYQFLVKVTELTQNAFTTLVEEGANSNDALPSASPLVTDPTNIVVQITGVPASLNVHFDGPATSTTGVTVGAPDSADITSTGTSKVLEFSFPITADSAGLDDVTFTFSLYLKSGKTLALGPSTVSANTFLGPVGDIADDAPTTSSLLFAQVDHTGDVSGVSDCVTNLLFPWVVYEPTFGYDTGIALANTTKDPFVVGGAAAQTGSCALYGYPTTPSTLGSGPVALAAIAYTTPSVPSGATWANSLSNIAAFNAADFTGYVIAVCNFQNGHGFAFISDNLGATNGITQGYVALIIPTPALASRSGGRGEGLDE